MLLNCGVGEDSRVSCTARILKNVNPKGNQSWIFVEKTDAGAEAPIFWPPDVNSLFTGKDPDAGKDWRQEEKGMTVDEMVGWHHWLNGHEFEQALGDGEGQRSLACCSPWCRHLATEPPPPTNRSWGRVPLHGPGLVLHPLLEDML